MPSAGTLRGRVQDAGVLGHHEDLLLSYQDISERGKEGQIRFAAKQQEQVFAVEWEVCGYEDHWVVLWGTGKRVSLLSVRGPGAPEQPPLLKNTLISAIPFRLLYVREKKGMATNTASLVIGKLDLHLLFIISTASVINLA